MNKLNGKIKPANTIKGAMKGTNIYPELEDLIVIPTTEEQKFKSEKYYGYNEVTVKGVEEVTVTNHYLEGQNVVIILSDGTKLIIDISEYINNNNIGTIAEIEQLIVSYFENKTVKEVEN